MKKIGVLGSGIVGKTLASGFLKHGHEVMLGSRDISKISDWKEKAGNNAIVGTFDETAKFGEIIVVATKGHAAQNAIRLAGIDNFTNKTVIDCTNPIDETSAPVNGVIKFYTNSGESSMERLIEIAPRANFVKAFSCVGAGLMVNPDFVGTLPTMFICGNSDDAKEEVKNILTQFGWEAEDLGKSNAAGTIENLCILWCIPGMLRNDWVHAFKMLKK